MTKFSFFTGVIFSVYFFQISSLHAKVLTFQQQTCVQELSTYKNKTGKQALTLNKANLICKKNASDNFLACVGGSERFLQGVETAVNFCSKHSTPQARACVQGLGSFKSAKGKPELSGSKIAMTCGKNSKQSFLDCVTQSERPLNSLDLAVGFCAKNPKEQTRRCVRELADYKTSKGKQMFTAKSLPMTCEKNSTTAFMDCLAKTKDAQVCGKNGGGISKRVPASLKRKKHSKNPASIESTKPKYLPKKKKISV